MAERICCGCNRATVDAKPWRGLYVCDDCRNIVGIPPAVRAELEWMRDRIVGRNDSAEDACADVTACLRRLLDETP